MSDWGKLVEMRAWVDLDDLWPSLKISEQRELLKALQGAVPEIADRNGVETRERHVLPEEAPEEWKGAAKILALGELEATVDGEPPNDTQIWSELRSDVEHELRELEITEEVTEGASALSRRQHAKDAVEYLDMVDLIYNSMQGEMDDEHGRNWLKEVISGAAWNAFLAGRHAQTAFYKRIEKSALSGEALSARGKKVAEITKFRHLPLREKRLARMKELIPSLGMENAAAQCETEGLGKMGAIIRQMNRWKKKDT